MPFWPFTTKPIYCRLLFMESTWQFYVFVFCKVSLNWKMTWEKVGNVETSLVLLPLRDFPSLSQIWLSLYQVIWPFCWLLFDHIDCSSSLTVSLILPQSIVLSLFPLFFPHISSLLLHLLLLLLPSSPAYTVSSDHALIFPDHSISLPFIFSVDIYFLCGLLE